MSADAWGSVAGQVAWLEGILRLADEAVIGLTPDGRVAVWNAGAERLLGCTAAEILGRTLSDRVSEDSRGPFDTLCRRVQGGQTATRESLILLDREGNAVPVLANAGSVRDAEANPVGMLILAQRQPGDGAAGGDVPVQQLQQARKLESLSVMAGGIAHDFNNLLMGILGNASLLLDDLPQGSPLRESLQQIEDSAVRAAELCSRMLAFSGRGKFVVGAVDLSALVTDVREVLAGIVGAGNSLEFNLSPDLPTIEADAVQLEQVLIDLVQNAADAIGEQPGLITVSTGTVEADRACLASTHLDDDLPPGQYVWLEVSDDGCGMDGATSQRVFDPFFSTKLTGRGMGLSAALGIIRSHRGAVRCSSSPGQGTTFRVLLPTVAEPQLPSETSDGRQPSSAGDATVLVIDDDETVRVLAARILQKNGFRVLTAGSGREGLEMYRRHSGEIGVVLLDMSMPGMNGDEVYRELRRMRPDVVVVLSSGYNESQAVSQFRGDGPYGFIQKPYRSAELVSRIREAASA